MVHDPQTGEYWRTRLFITMLGYNRKAVPDDPKIPTAKAKPDPALDTRREHPLEWPRYAVSRMVKQKANGDNADPTVCFASTHRNQPPIRSEASSVTSGLTTWAFGAFRQDIIRGLRTCYDVDAMAKTDLKKPSALCGNWSAS